MFRSSLAGLDRRKLRLGLSLFFITLIVPTGLLIYKAYTQLKWEAFYQHRLLAEELTGRIDKRLFDLIVSEEKRSFSDYSFLLLSGDASANYLQRSPLATFPVATGFPGLIGYFQVDTNGLFSTPLLPVNTDDATRYGIPPAELAQRTSIADNLHLILSQNQLVETGARKDEKSFIESRELMDRDEILGRTEMPLEEEGMLELSLDDKLVSRGSGSLAREPPQSQVAFDLLKGGRFDEETSQAAKKSARVFGNLGKVEELKLDQVYASKKEKESSKEKSKTQNNKEKSKTTK